VKSVPVKALTFLAVPLCLVGSTIVGGTGDEVLSLLEVPSASLAESGLKIPSFYASRRVYKLKGRSHHKPVLFLQDGSIQTLEGGPSLEDLSGQADERTGSREANMNKWWASPSGQWEIRLATEVDSALAYGRRAGHAKTIQFLYIRNVETNTTDRIPVPTRAWGMWPLFWHPDLDRFYFYVVAGGASQTTHGEWLLELDPKSKRIWKIGSHGGLPLMSPGGEWILWETGFGMASLGTMGLWVTHIVAYDPRSRQNFRLTEGASVNRILKWAPRSGP